MTALFIEYPKCSTCQKAKKWLNEHDISFEDRHIVESNPTADELMQWIRISTKPVKSFFNTSGLLYKSMELKSKLPTMNESECIELLASNGMLVKRPLLISDAFILIGFRESEWQEKLLGVIK